MTAADYETKVRTYLNEVTANFYTQAEIWLWLSSAAREISQQTLCIRRRLSCSTCGNNVRHVNINAYKAIHVQYGTKMLPKCQPIRLGRDPFYNSTYPQYWYEYGNLIGIEPMPDNVYDLKVYVADVAKIYSTSPWTDWTAGARWSLGDSYTHTGASSSLTLTAGITNAVNYTFEFEISNIGASSNLFLTAGSQMGAIISTNGWHTQNIVSTGTSLTITAYGDVAIDNFKIYKEATISATTDVLEFDDEWETSVALYATYCGLLKDKAYPAAALLYAIYKNDFDYIRQNIVEVIPDGSLDLTYR
jgi:hypothetical protein